MRLTMLDRPRYYLSLGDSMSIDAYAGGPGRGAASLLKANHDTSFPDWVGRDLSTAFPNIRLVPLAQDGATAATVRYVQLPHLAEMKIAPEIVTLTMGGNDLIQCWRNDQAAADALKALRENGNAILTVLRRLLPANAPILVGTIYDPSDGSGNAGGLQLMDWPTALHWLKAFNVTLTEIAQTHDACLVDIHAAFLGHGLSAGDPSQHAAEPVNRDLWYCGIIEPNAWGASAIRGLWWDALHTIGFLKQVTEV